MISWDGIDDDGSASSNEFGEIIQLNARHDDEDAWSELLDRYAEDFPDEYAMSPPPMPTGIHDVDKELGGGIPAVGVTVVGATAGTGKTALALNWAYAWSRQGMRPLVFSLELPRHKVWERIVSLHSSLTGGLREVAWGDMGSVIDSVAGEGTRESFFRAEGRARWELVDRYIDAHRADDPALVAWDSLGRHHITERIVVVDDRYELSTLCKIVTTLTENGWHGPVIVDYAQMVACKGKDSEYDRVTEVSREFTKLAKDRHVPVILISSLKKLGAKEDEPTLDWFRGTGYIGYDATCAVILTRGGTSGEETSVDMHVIKNRQGTSGNVASLTFTGRLGRFD